MNRFNKMNRLKVKWNKKCDVLTKRILFQNKYYQKEELLKRAFCMKRGLKGLLVNL